LLRTEMDAATAATSASEGGASRGPIVPSLETQTLGTASPECFGERGCDPSLCTLAQNMQFPS
jgi:hypothetical protein